MEGYKYLMSAPHLLMCIFVLYLFALVLLVVVRLKIEAEEK